METLREGLPQSSEFAKWGFCEGVSYTAALKHNIEYVYGLALAHMG